MIRTFSDAKSNVTPAAKLDTNSKRSRWLLAVHWNSTVSEKAVHSPDGIIPVLKLVIAFSPVDVEGNVAAIRAVAVFPVSLAYPYNVAAYTPKVDVVKTPVPDVKVQFEIKPVYKGFWFNNRLTPDVLLYENHVTSSPNCAE